MGVGKVDPRVLRTRERVLAVAVELLAEVGIAGLTIDAVAQRSGVARSTVYRNWPERTDLLLDAFETIKDIPDVVVADEDDMTVEWFATVLTERGRLLAALPETTLGRNLPAIVAASVADPAVAEALSQFGRNRRHPLVTASRSVIERQGLEPTIDVDVAIDRFIAPFFYRFLLTRDTCTADFIADQVARTLADLGAGT